MHTAVVFPVRSIYKFHLKRHFLPLMLLLTLPMAALAKQDANEFVDMLNAEAEEGGAVAETVDTSPKLKINVNSTPAQLADSPQSFENKLQSKFAATYFIYQKLTDSQKNQVFEAYRKSGNFSEVRSLVLEVFQRH